MQKIYPFKFLDAYTREDSHIFFGRNAEVETLYEMVFQTDLLLIYDASGTGKTSLIQCGLASKFQSHDWLALNIRRGKNLNTSFENALIKEGANSLNETDDWDWLDEDFNSESPEITTPTPQLSPLTRSLKTIYLKHFKPIYLIFDQFEELYILGNKDEQNAFIQTVQEILKVEQPVKIILSIREEYLGYLYDFERKVPELLRKKLRVEPMNLDKVKTVVKKVGNLQKGNIRLQKGKEEVIAEQIFEKIKGKDKILTIQLPYLQVFLDKLYLQITQDKTRQTDALFSLEALQKMGDIGDVLRNFLDDQVIQIARDLQEQPDVIWKILSPFVTLDGTKEPISTKLLSKRLPKIQKTLIQTCLQALVKSRILRYTENEQVYEIAHDSLAKQVHAKRSDEEIAILEVQRLIRSQVALKAENREFFTSKQLDFIEPYLSQLNLSFLEKKHLEESQRVVRKRKNFNRAILLFIFLFLLIIIGIIWTQQQQTQKALEATEKAKIEAQQSLVNAFKTDIQRFEIKIGIANTNIEDFKRFDADVDVIELENQKIKDLKYKIDSLNTKIQSIEQ
ncbi:MAG: hypothetical protein ACPG49_07815 [Chitinophagales bacterium]